MLARRRRPTAAAPSGRSRAHPEASSPRVGSDGRAAASQRRPDGTAALRVLLHGTALVLLAVALGPESAGAEDGRPPLDGRAVAFALHYGPVSEPADGRTGRPGGRALQPHNEGPCNEEPRDEGPRDAWWAHDKVKHLVVSTLWTLSTQYVLVAKAEWSDGDALPASVGSAAAVGLAKEVYDRRVGATGHFSWKDLAADAAGIGLGSIVILL